MQVVTSSISVSIDGFLSGPRHHDEGLHRVQDWVHRIFGGGEADGAETALLESLYANVGAYVMGRTMFDVGERPWGDEPPFGTPVFVVTHRPRVSIYRGATTFEFGTRGGVAEAVARAREAAGRKDVHIAGGGKIVSQALACGLIDELHLHIAPVLLGTGMRLFDCLPRPVEFEIAALIASPHATHICYRRRQRG
jgi:dihydrofolate reductase